MSGMVGRSVRTKGWRLLVLVGMTLVGNLLQTACNSGSSSTATSTSANGVVQAARIANATIDAFRIVDGVVEETPYATTTSDADGNFSIQLSGLSRKTTMVFRATGGSYVDEATGETVELDRAMETFLPGVVNGEVSNVAITLLTNASARLIRESSNGNITENLVKNVNRKVGEILGAAGDIVTTMPTDLDGGTGGQSQKQIDYAVILAGLSKLAFDQGIAPNEMIDLVAEDLADGIPDGLNGDVQVFEDPQTLSTLLAQASEESAADFGVALSSTTKTSLEGFKGADNGKPITVLSFPVGGETLSGLINVTWTTTDTKVGTVQILLSGDSGTSFATEIVAAAPDTGNYTWDASELPSGGTYRLRVIATDAIGNEGNRSSSARDFALDNTLPVIRLLAPTGDQLLSGVATVRWSTTDNDPDTVAISLSYDGGESFETMVTENAPDSGRYEWDTTGVADGDNVRLRIVAINADGLRSASVESSESFSIDNTRPQISLTGPEAGALLAGTVDITWETEDANPGTVQIRLSTDGGLNYDTTIAEAAPDTGSYAWDSTGIDEAQDLRLRIRATDAADNGGNASASTAGFDIDNVPPEVELDFPTGGNFLAGSVNILWESTESEDNTVDILLSTDGGDNFDVVLAEGIEDDGSFTWDTTEIDDTASARIRVVATDMAGNASEPALSSSNVVVDNTAPVITLSSPTGANLLKGSVSITWNTVETNRNTVAIALSTNGGTSYDTVVSASETDDGSYTWDTTGVADAATLRVRVVATDDAGNSSVASTSASNFTVDNTAPVVALTSVSGGQVIGGAAFSLTWSTTEANPDTVAIALSSNGGTSYDTVLSATETDDGSYTWDTTGLEDGATYRIRVVATDDLDTVGTAATSSANLTIDNTAPAIDLTSPTGGNFLRGSVSVTWNTVEDNPGTVAVALSNNGGTSYDTVLSASEADDGSYTWNTTGVADGSTYRIRVVPTDDAGNVGDMSISASNFTVDNTVPVVTVTSPAGGETLEGTVNITWSSTETNKNTVAIALSSNGGTSYDTVLSASETDDGSYSWDTTTVEDGTTYRIRVVATDDAGNQSVAATSSANFEVSDAVDIFTFFYSDTNESDGSNPVVIADMDGNGDLDVLAGYSGVSTLIWVGDGGGGFSSSMMVGGTGAQALAVGDFDDDDQMDFVEGFSQNGFKVSFNNGDLAFIDGQHSMTSDSVQDLAAVDVDGDDDLDLIVATQSNGAQVWLNDGSGTFTDSTQRLSEVAFSIATGDLDNDSNVDLIIGSNNYEIASFLNDGNGVFSLVDEFGDDLTRDVALADVDNDGDLDLLEGDAFDTCFVWYNDGEGSFEQGPAIAEDQMWRTSLAIGDVDDDGDVDLVASGSDATACMVLLNDGEGNFTEYQTLRNGNAVALADMDGDEDLDLVMSDVDWGVSIWGNTFNDDE